MMEIKHLWSRYLFNDNPLSETTLFVWKWQHSPPKLKEKIATLVRKIPIGIFWRKERLFVISNIEARMQRVGRLVFENTVNRILWNIENSIKYPQSFIIIKKLSIIQTSISWNIFSTGGVCFFVLKSWKELRFGRVRNPQSSGLP